MKNIKLIAACALICSACSPALLFAQAPSTKLPPLTVFVDAFNRAAKFDQEPALALRACASKIIQNKKEKIFDCKTGAAPFVSGVLNADGSIRFVEYFAKPQSPDDMHSLRRSARYLVRAVRGQLVLGEGTMVMELLAATSKANGALQQKAEGGISFGAAKDKDGGWSFSAELPAIP